MSDKASGRFYAVDRHVFREPIARKQENGTTNFTLGFRVCRADEALGDKGAELLASILNEAIDKGIITEKDA